MSQSAEPGIFSVPGEKIQPTVEFERMIQNACTHRKKTVEFERMIQNACTHSHEKTVGVTKCCARKASREINTHQPYSRPAEDTAANESATTLSLPGTWFYPNVSVPK